MALKKPTPPAGAPDWIVTYGDMMSLLLCFFILLAAMANFDKQDKRMMTAIESIREALGSPGQQGWLPDESIDFKSLLLQLTSLVSPPTPAKSGETDQFGVDGRFYRVRQIREGLEVAIGGPIIFDRFEARLNDESRTLIRTIAQKIRGHRNKIEIRGHATYEPLPKESPIGDPLNLSYARARNVYDMLVAEGIDPNQLRILAAGPYEPINKNAYTDAARGPNRRVEIIVLEKLVSDYDRAANDAAAPTSRPES